MKGADILEREDFLKKLRTSKGSDFALFLIDIDDFKLVNFSYGYGVGNKVISAFGRKISAVFKKYFSTFWVGRTGSDSFGVLIKGLDEELVFKRLKEIYNTYFERLTFKISDDIFFLTTSASAVFCKNETFLEDLFKMAEESLYSAKNSGKNCMVFGRNYSVQIKEIQKARKVIVDAIENRTIEPYFQPIVSLRTGRIFGYEVLARIFSGDNLLKGDYVVDIASTFSLISEIDRIVFEKASAYLGNGYKLFFNLSMKYFFKELNNIWRVVKDKSLDSSDIVIEITESQKIMEMNVAKSIFQIFRDMDVKVAIDDFGSGYSSYSYLKRFSADILKVDGEFVKGAKTDIRDLTIMKSIVDSARPFRLRVLAEFIEDEEDYRLMRDIGVALGQGWFIGKPKPEPYDVKIDI